MQNLTARRRRARILRERQRTQRAQARLRRRGIATMAGHCLAAGLTPKDARSMATSLRRNAAKAACHGVAGRSYAGKAPARDCVRYTPAEVALAASLYRPRRTDFQQARNLLIQGAAR
ncbi:hypothetical protein [Streptomyces sp. WAC00469]|uniref:hypothetical protein n=1 Tax=Streptomyces sp. WAC00469 TaxID=2487415 RepID=UPI000F73DECB|nr:hypothetical protein [Streptomyces sp. WAC00469]RSR95430.1 hypothetical protein EF917_25715 [Streptomyces sp. WAC00469]